MTSSVSYPSTEEIRDATHEQLARWHRFLPSPATVTERELLEQIEERYQAAGGMTPEISKTIGWQNP